MTMRMMSGAGGEAAVVSGDERPFFQSEIEF